MIVVEYSFVVQLLGGEVLCEARLRIRLVEFRKFKRAVFVSSREVIRYHPLKCAVIGRVLEILCRCLKNDFRFEILASSFCRCWHVSQGVVQEPHAASLHPATRPPGRQLRRDSDVPRHARHGGRGFAQHTCSAGVLLKEVRGGLVSRRPGIPVDPSRSAVTVRGVWPFKLASFLSCAPRSPSPRSPGQSNTTISWYSNHCHNVGSGPTGSRFLLPDGPPKLWGRGCTRRAFWQ